METGEWVGRLRTGELDVAEVGGFLTWLLDGAVSAGSKADALMAWAARGETIEEMAALALALREMAVPVPAVADSAGGPLVDLCGTGGDGRQTFNVSTCASFVVAGSGIRVAKHGNRGATSKSGGFDVLEVMGFRIDAGPDVAAACLAETGMCFLFAPLYHPAFKQLAPVRKLAAERQSRTIFNFLGPLLNPARPQAQVVGVPDLALPPKYAAVLGRMGLRRAVAACGRTETGAPMDEFSTIGLTDAAEWMEGRVETFQMDPVTLGFSPCDSAVFSVADAAGSAEVIRAILCGEERGPSREIVELNAAAAMRVAGRGEDWAMLLGMAREAIDSRAAWRKLEQVRAFLRR
ncbi:MAG TPA: anthranilate phosphoribosyltransferase [Verrucomicrobiae bacterium]|nr:anthranilate phosphoribosyltransferase [Verrucomicrobiae bacterium]